MTYNLELMTLVCSVKVQVYEWIEAKCGTGYIKTTQMTGYHVYIVFNCLLLRGISEKEITKWRLKNSQFALVKELSFQK